MSDQPSRHVPKKKRESATPGSWLRPTNARIGPSRMT